MSQSFFKGQVLRGARVASSNSPTTSSAQSGVSSHVQSFDLVQGGSLVQVNVDQYRASFLGDLSNREEFLIWADQDAPLTEARFWWTRNDPYAKRFAWDGSFGSWKPLRGGSVKSLGPLVPGQSYILSPKPQNLTVGQYLLGSALSDSYAMLRVGALPNTASYPIAEGNLDFSGILVVEDTQADASYPFVSVAPPLAGVIGETNGRVVFSPDFIEAYLGSPLWYAPQTFEETSSGIVGDLGEELFISPIPFLTERPILRIGNRRALEVLLADNDSELDSYTISSSQVGVSASTGRLKFNVSDVNRANPQSPEFDVLFLGAKVFYDGISCNLVSQPLRAPVNLVDSNGTSVQSLEDQRLFIPTADLSSGLGISGILEVPDGTGSTPDPLVTPQIRPNGSGLVRQVFDIGDAFIFSPVAAIEETVVVDANDELPQFEFHIDSKTALVAREASAHGSEVKISKATRLKFRGLPIYFSQAVCTPATYVRKARIFSRVRNSFTFDGSEKLYFSIDGSTYLWNAPQGTFTAPEVASNLNAIIIGSGQASAISGRVVLESGDLSTGSVKIGYLGTSQGDSEYLSSLAACRALGFLPAWTVDNPSASTGLAVDKAWLPDTGSSLGMFRTPVNLTGELSTSDVRTLVRFEDVLISDSVSPLIFQFLDKAPLEDVAGYDTGKFFKIVDGQFSKVLEHYKDVQYLFSDRKFAWLDSLSKTSVVESPTSVLSLGQAGVLPDSLSPVLDGRFEVSVDGGSYGALTRDQDYILPFDGDSGVATLIKRYGDLKLSGSKGRFDALSDIFTDTSSDFSSVQAGYRLKLTSGDDVGSYKITEIISSNSLKTSPQFINGDSGKNISWEIFEGFDPDTLDPTILADVTFKPFEHLSEEPFKIRILRNMGETGNPDMLLTDPSRAIEVGRKVNVRMGLDGATLSVLFLQRQNLGTMTNNSLVIPDTTDTRFASKSFSILIGDVLFTHDDGTLVGVAAFTEDPTLVEYLNTGTQIGLLNFGSDILSDLAASSVVYVESLRPSSEIPTGIVEIDPQTGFGAISANNIGSSNIPLFFVQEMISGTENDVTINPLGGSLNFTTPLQTGDIIEVSYTVAKSDGTAQVDDDQNPVKVTEFLPIFIRNETCSRLNATNYTFNPVGRTIDASVDIDVYTGSRLKNYGISPEVFIRYEENLVTFTTPIDESEKITVTYAVFEATGGETSFTVSTPPIYRPPFNLNSGQTTFTLDHIREDLQAGQVLSLGNQRTYIKSVLVADNQTTVEIYPAFTQDAGSLSPGNDASNLITDRPINPVVDPSNPVVTGASLGIFPTAQTLFNTNGVYFEPVSKGATVIRFQGNLTAYIKDGHALDVNGTPFGVASSKISEDGLWTETNIFPASPTALSPVSGSVRVSVRPIYLPQIANLQGLGPIVAEDSFELVLFGEMDAQGRELAGRTLIQKIDYEIDTSTGAITLLQPRQKPLQANQTLYLSHTRLGVLSPFMSQGVLQKPRYRFSHLYRSQPSSENGLEGVTLQATYSFENPDSFYYESTPLSNIAGQVTEDLQNKATSSTASSGPLITVGGSTDNGEQGAIGIESKSAELFNQDRAARRYLKFYNQIIIAFEQISESISGSVVGDRDGKFRFDYQTDTFQTPQGAEDQISGRLNPRNVFLEVFNAARGGTNPIVIDPSDSIVNPLTATVDALGRVSGKFLDPDDIQTLLEYQRDLIRNDVDDLLVIRLNRVKRKLTGIIRYQTSATGLYKPMRLPHRFSRIYPEETQAFTTLNPGVFADEDTGNVGVYTAGRVAGGSPFAFIKTVLAGKTRSTTGKVIGTISNPVLGVLENIQRASVRQRLPRARIWAYSSTGFEGLTSRPALIATPLRLIDFPIDNTTGLPDTSQLYSQGGGLFDLDTGDIDLDTPPFKIGQQLALGFPDGQTSPLASPAFVGIGVLGGVFVDEIIQGCVITFKDVAQNSIMSGSDILVATSNTSGTLFEPNFGDTIYIIPKNSTEAALQDPLSQSDLRTLASSIPTYRVGFDIDIDRREGQFIDATLPSFDDPAIFATKELFGQNPPPPSSSLESRVRFSNQSNEPVLIPALQGLAKLDSGDVSLPYLLGSSELEALSNAANAFETIFVDSPSPPAAGYAVEAVYPDETFDSDGLITSQLSPPIDLTEIASLITTQDVFRRTSSGAYPPPPGRAGVGDLARYDLVFVEPSNTLPMGSMGILSVGEVSGTSTRGKIEPPRFITPVSQDMTLRYNLVNGIVHESAPAYIDGFAVTEVVGATVLTTFDSSTIAAVTICYDNNSGGGALIPPIGGFNHFFNTIGDDAEIRIQLISAGGLDTDPQGQFATPATVIIRKVGGALSVSGDNGGLFIATNFVYFTNQVIQIDTAAPFFDFTRFDNLVVGPTTTIQGLRGFAIDVQVPNTVAVGSGGTATIEQDRLTFTETFNLSASQPRGTVHSISGISLETTLDVEDIDIALSDTSGGASTLFTTSVNSSAETNGGVALSFLSRGVTGSSAYGVGSFTAGTAPAATDSLSTIKAMAFEGHGNAPINSNEIKFSTLPSSPQGAAGPILRGKAIVDRFNYASSYQNIVLPYEKTGEYNRIEKGDICTIKLGQSEVPSAQTTTLKTGTYLIRGAVPPETDGALNTVVEYKEITIPPTTIIAKDWLDFEYPKIVDFNQVAGTLTVDQIPQIVEARDGVGNVIPSQPLFETVGPQYLYIITDVSKITANTDDEYNKTLIRFEYTTLVGNTFTLNMGTQTPASGVGIADLSAIQIGQPVSGMRYLPVSLGQYGDIDLNGLSGWTSITGPDWLFGFPGLTLSNDEIGSSINYPSDDTSVANPALIYEEPQVSNHKIGIYQGEVNLSTSFLPGINSVVYPDVPKVLDLGTGNVAVDYNTLHPTPVGVSGSIVHCILPTDKFEPLIGSNYRSRAGLFFEPSFPRPVNNLKSLSYNVVSQSFGPLTEVGERPLSVTGVPASGAVEAAEFEVRRIRRFHEPMELANEAFIKLRGVYEIRRGTVSVGAYTQTGSYGVLVVDSFGPSNTATQIGDFTETIVNVNAGDVFRLIFNDGTLAEEVEILAVSGAKTLILNSPGLQTAINTTLNFEIYLKQAPVPHEQSNEQLLTLLTSEILLDRSVDYSIQRGGFVEYISNPNLQVAYEQSVNILKDTDSINFNQLGIQAGDYLLIDPSGELSGQTGKPAQAEFGARPFGDFGILGRQAEPGVYVPGAPSELDDNRGYYRIESISDDGLSLTVTASKNQLSGDIMTGDMVLDSSFVVYPTIHGSNLSLGNEGQNDLRPTSFAGQNGSPLNSFKGNALSVGPFAYKILRPSGAFSDEAIELVLAMRERMLSWIEELKYATTGAKGGSYFIFQRDDHITELGDLTNPLVGLGLISNAMIETTEGRVNLSPFTNTSDCLSILDRRFWILDVRLDALRPPLDPLASPYASFTSTGTGRPVLPDRIDRVLNQSDNFRQSRYAWLNYRTNLITGLLSEIDRFESEKSRLKKEQRELLQQIGDTEE